MMHIADNHDALLDYLYEEGDPAERLKMARHLQDCASCSVVMLEFQTVRGMLREWKEPASPLGFRLVQGPESLQPRAPRGWWVPQTRPGRWAQAAAALLLFVAGMAVSQLTVNYGEGALPVRQRSDAPSGAGTGIRNTSILLPPSPQAMPEPQTATNLVPVETLTGDAANEQLLQRVRAMIEQSEVRQQRELALRLSQVAREVDTQHSADLQRIQQNLGQFEIETGAQINQQRQQIMDYLVRTSGGSK